MIRVRFLTTVLCIIFSFATIFAQNPSTELEGVEVQVTHAQFLGKTPPVRELAPLQPTSPERRKFRKQVKKEVPNFIGRGTRPEHNPNALPQGEDKIRQTSAKFLGLVVVPIVNINGISSNATPPDPTGDIGKDFYIQAVNATTYKVYDKTGTAVSGNISANTLWSSLGFSSLGDPIVMYDQEAERWIITEFPNANQLLFAISETTDPMGSWMVYNFGTPSFPDYPKYAIWNNAYVVTTNEQGPGNLPAYFIDRQAMLAGDAMVPIQRVTIPGLSGAPGFFVGTPVDWSGNNAPPAGANPMILRLNDDGWGTTPQDQIDIFEVEIDWNNANNTNVTMVSAPTAPFDTYPCSAGGPGFSCIPQQGGNGIDGLPETIMHQVHYRNFGSHEAMVMNFITDATGTNVSGIRWIEMRRTPGNDWSVYQEGTYAPDDGLHRFMGSICMDASGGIGLAYSVSGTDIFPGLRFTGRRAGDPLGEMTVDEYEIVAGASSNQGSRYGDYAHMSVDPVNQRTFWFTGQYRGNNGSRTRIVAFELGKDTLDLGPTSLNTPKNSPDLTNAEIVEIQIKNFGIDTQAVYNVGFIFQNGTEVVEPVNFILAPDSIYTHTFLPTVDMSVVGKYDFTVFSALINDEAIFNDTLKFVIEKLPRWDAGILSIAGFESVTCADSTNVNALLTNFGIEELTSVTIDISLNGNAYETINWTGSLLSGEMENVSFALTGFNSGDNNISATTSNPNGTTDENPANDEFARTFNALVDGASVSLLLKTDNFPEETTWQLTDNSGNVLYLGGPYGQDGTVYEEIFCLDPTACYIFTIFDGANDGICCNWGNGNYSIVDAEGLPLLVSDGTFGSQESSEFCAMFECSLEGDIDTSPASAVGADDGTIMVTAMNGIAPVQYSIDSGQTFQASNIFNNLPGGIYDIVVSDAAGCLFATEVTVESCAMEFTATILNEIGVGAMNGQIEMNITSGMPPYEYRLNNEPWQSNNVFTGLGTGTYTVRVRDSIGCEISIEVTVDFETDTDEIHFGQTIEVFPNPTEGVFRINVEGLDRSDVFLPFEIYDVAGKLIQSSNLVKYDDVFTGQVSVVAYPSGTYFVRFLDENMNRLVRVVKQ